LSLERAAAPGRNRRPAFFPLRIRGHGRPAEHGYASGDALSERWLAVLRIAVGVWFAKAIFTKLSITLAFGFLPVPTASDRWQHLMPVLVTKYAEGNPIGFFKDSF